MIFCTIIIIFILVILFLKYVLIPNNEKKNIEFVKNYSIALNKLKNINEKYSFYEIKQGKYVHEYDDRNMYDNISCEDYLIYILTTAKYQVKKDMGYISYNAKKYEEYKNEISKINDFGCFYISPKKKNKKILEIEKQEFNKLLLQPTVSYSIMVELYFRDNMGKIANVKRRTFIDKDINDLINDINKQEGTYYLKRYIWDSICRVERGNVSLKMRTIVFRRDSYRCKCCKRTRDEVNLEVDHIKPISKGGKSELNNLQTLCVDCNQNKGDKEIRY